MPPIAWYTSSIPNIEEARDKQEWFNAIVLSAITLERHGYIKIKRHLSSLKLKYRKDNLENLSLPDITLFLLALKKIEVNDYEKMLDINSVRNKFIHRRDIYKFLVGTEAKAKYEPLVNEAIRILKEKLGAVKIIVSR
jgi:hypothetical protein